MIIKEGDGFGKIACLLGDQYVNRENQVAINCNESGLCTSPNINFWAKYKPVIHPCTESNRPADWWKSTNWNCGIDFKEHRYLTDLIRDYVGEVEQFVYQPPYGGSNSPYRIHDFDGYNSLSMPPAHGSNVDGFSFAKSDTALFNAIIRQESENELTVDDIFGTLLYDCYYGIAMEDKTSGELYWKTSDKNFRECGISGPSVDFNMNRLTVDHSYFVYQFITSARQTIESIYNNIAAQYVALPAGINSKSIQSISVKSAHITFALRECVIEEENFELGTLETLKGKIVVNNSLQDGYMLNDIVIEWRYASSSDKMSYLPGEGSNNSYFSDFAAPLGSSSYAFNIEVPGILGHKEYGDSGRVNLYINQKKVATTLILTPKK